MNELVEVIIEYCISEDPSSLVTQVIKVNLICTEGRKSVSRRFQATS